MISGECRVEGIPSTPSSSPAARKLALDGLRLQLDLRIVPDAAGGDAAAAAVWRFESERVATLPLRAAPTYRIVAVAAGVAVLLLAVCVWFLDVPRAPEPRWTPVPSAPPVAPSLPARTAPARETPAPSSLTLRALDAGSPSVGAAAVVAPRITALPREVASPSPAALTPSPAALTPSPSPARSSLPRGGARSAASPAPSASLPATAGRALRASRESAAAAPAAPSGGAHGAGTDADLLELFSDTR